MLPPTTCLSKTHWISDHCQGLYLDLGGDGSLPVPTSPRPFISLKQFILVCDSVFVICIASCVFPFFYPHLVYCCFISFHQTVQFQIEDNSHAVTTSNCPSRCLYCRKSVGLLRESPGGNLPISFIQEGLG